MSDKAGKLPSSSVLGETPELTAQEHLERREALLTMAKATGVAGLATAALLTSRRVRAASSEI